MPARIADVTPVSSPREPPPRGYAGIPTRENGIPRFAPVLEACVKSNPGTAIERDGLPRDDSPAPASHRSRARQLREQFENARRIAQAARSCDPFQRAGGQHGAKARDGPRSGCPPPGRRHRRSCRGRGSGAATPGSRRPSARVHAGRTTARPSPNCRRLRSTPQYCRPARARGSRPRYRRSRR